MNDVDVQRDDLFNAEGMRMIRTRYTSDVTNDTIQAKATDRQAIQMFMAKAEDNFTLPMFTSKNLQA